MSQALPPPLHRISTTDVHSVSHTALHTTTQPRTQCDSLGSHGKRELLRSTPPFPRPSLSS